MWKRDGVGLLPEFDILCNYCGSKMEQHHIGMQRFALDLSKPDKMDSYAFDVYMECPECFLEEVFGVAVPEYFYNEVLGTLCKSGILEQIQ